MLPIRHSLAQNVRKIHGQLYNEFITQRMLMLPRLSKRNILRFKNLFLPGLTFGHYTKIPLPSGYSQHLAFVRNIVFSSNKTPSICRAQRTITQDGLRTLFPICRECQLKRWVIFSTINDSMLHFEEERLKSYPDILLHHLKIVVFTSRSGHDWSWYYYILTAEWLISQAIFSILGWTLKHKILHIDTKVSIFSQGKPDSCCYHQLWGRREKTQVSFIGEGTHVGCCCSSWCSPLASSFVVGLGFFAKEWGLGRMIGYLTCRWKIKIRHISQLYFFSIFMRWTKIEWWKEI